MTRPTSVLQVLTQLTRSGSERRGATPFGQGLLTDYIRWQERNRGVPVDHWLELQPREQQIGRPW